MIISGGRFNIVSVSLKKTKIKVVAALIRSYNTVKTLIIYMSSVVLFLICSTVDNGVVVTVVVIDIAIGIVKVKGRQTVASGGQNNRAFGTNNVILVSTVFFFVVVYEWV